MALSPEEADRRLCEAVAAAGMEVGGSPGAIRAKASRAIRKNRWAADVSIDLAPLGSGSSATCRVDMPAGTKHFEILSDIAEAVGDDAFATVVFSRRLNVLEKPAASSAAKKSGTSST